MTKREASRVAVALGITLLILVPGLFLVTGVRMPLAACVGMTEAENIRHFTSFRIVPPEWVAPGDAALYSNWMKAEALARLVIVLMIWIGAMIFVDPGKWTKRKSNTTLDGIRQPANGLPKPSR